MKRPLLAALTLAALGLATNVRAGTLTTVPAEPRSANGGYQASWTLGLPAFHGIEPKLALSYDSSRRNGLVGAGFHLDGPSRIVARHPKGGLPVYDGTDEYALDDELLVACSGARCLGTGGTHVTEHHSFQRIVRDPTNDRWLVTSADGTLREYARTVALEIGTYSWELKRVTDLHGNVVTYSYVNDQRTAYLDRITYGDVVVSFTRGTRPDPVSFQPGGAIPGVMAQRLAAIKVAVGGATRRLWVFSYGTSLDGSSQSRLAAFIECGSDSSYDLASGGIYGTCLPATSFRYDGPSALPGFAARDVTVSGDFGGDGTSLVGDVNGDGRADLVWVRRTTSALTVRALASTGTGFAAPVSVAVPGDHSTWTATLADVDGDGRSDVVLTSMGTTWRTRILLANGTGGFTVGALQTMGTCTSCPSSYVGYSTAIGDSNRDGVADLYAWRATSSNATTVKATAVRDGGGTFAAPVATVWPGNYSGRRLLLGDYRARGGANGENFPAPTAGAVEAWSAVDANGDGGDDLVRVTFSASSAHAWLDHLDAWSLSGADAQNANQWHQRTSAVQVDPRTMLDKTFFDVSRGTVSFADLNGDGRADLYAAANDGTMKVAVMLSQGDGFAPLVSGYAGALLGAGGTPFVAGDFDGDGRADLATSSGSGTSLTVRLLTSTAPYVGRLVQVESPLGAITTITYDASSSYDNDYLPVGFVTPVVKKVTTNDGRGHVATRTYDYAGGLWSDAERDFVGFARVTSTDDLGTKTETLYRQTRAAMGLPEVVTVSNASDLVYTQKRTTYLERESATPFYALVASETSSRCNLTPNPLLCKARQIDTSWDTTYGVPVGRVDHGDLSVTGDETATLFTYAQNDVAFLGDRVSLERTFAGTSSDGPLLRRTTRFYDGATAAATPSRGDLTLERVWHDGPGYTAVDTTQTFDAAGNLTSRTDDLGRTTTTSYDASGVFPIRSCNAIGHCRSLAWDRARGVVTSRTDENGNVTSFLYDPLGRVTRRTFPNGGWESTSYVSFNGPGSAYIETATSDGTLDGLWSRSYIDGFGRTYIEQREGGSTRYTEYALQAPSAVARRSRWTTSGAAVAYETFTRDGLGRITRQTHPDGTYQQTVYGVDRTITTDELGHVSAVALDAKDNATEIIEGTGRTARSTFQSFDALGRVIQATDAKGNVTTFAYDSLDRRTGTCDPDRGCIVTVYDEASNPIATTDAKGQTVVTTYDALDRPLTRTGGYVWTYDEAGHANGKGHLTSHSFPTGSDAYAYDFAGRVTTRTMTRDGVTRAVGTRYDTTGKGRRVATTLAGETITETYDTRGNVNAVGGYASAIAYDAEDRVVSLTLGNGVIETFGYDALTGRPSTHDVKRGATFLLRESYAFDAGGNVTTAGVTTNGTASTLTLGYDERDRLTAVAGSQAEAFTYDALGNITSRSSVGAYAYGTKAHAVTSAGAGAYAYDANGNMISGGGRTLGWDEQDRLVSVRTDAGALTELAYDGTGQRVRRAQGTQVATFYGDRLESESGSLYGYVMLGDRRLARKDLGTGAVVYFHSDLRGSTRVLTSETGATLRTYDYSPTGAVASTTLKGASTNIRYAGTRDDVPGLLYLGARYYDPALGRFVSADTIVPEGSPQQLNRYTYANNSPFTFVDPDGHSSVTSFNSSSNPFSSSSGSSTSSTTSSSSSSHTLVNASSSSGHSSGSSSSSSSSSASSGPSLLDKLRAALGQGSSTPAKTPSSAAGTSSRQASAQTSTITESGVTLLRSSTGHEERAMAFWDVAPIDGSDKVILRSGGRMSVEEATYLGNIARWSALPFNPQ